MAMLSARNAVGYSTLLIPARTVTTAGTITGGAAGAGVAWILKGLSPYDYLQATLDLTAAATEAGDTLSVYVDTTFDGGLVWVNLARFTTILGNGGAKRETIVVNPTAQTATAPVNTAADAASGAVRHILGDWLRVREVTVDAVTTTNMSFTYSLSLKLS